MAITIKNKELTKTYKTKGNLHLQESGSCLIILSIIILLYCFVNIKVLYMILKIKHYILEIKLTGIGIPATPIPHSSPACILLIMIIKLKDVWHVCAYNLIKTIDNLLSVLVLPDLFAMHNAQTMYEKTLNVIMDVLQQAQNV